MKITRFSIGWLCIDVKFFEIERSAFISTVWATSTLYEIFNNLTKFCPVPFPQNIYFDTKKRTLGTPLNTKKTSLASTAFIGLKNLTVTVGLFADSK